MLKLRRFRDSLYVYILWLLLMVLYLATVPAGF